MIDLRHYQAGSTPAVIEYFKKQKNKHPIVAMPTGSGKTYSIADLIQYCRKQWNVKVVVLSHVKEILEQNYDSLSEYLDEEVSLNSSMLGRREIGNITVAGIQSVYRNPELFNGHNLIIVDEAHRISVEEGTMYEQFFKGIGKFICVGFTATPYRLGTGYIFGKHADTFFDDVCYDWTDPEHFLQLIAEEWLCPHTYIPTSLNMDISDINLKGGEYNDKQLSDKFDRQAVTNAAIAEIMAKGQDRNKWMIFAIDTKHAEHIAEVLIRNGIPTAVVHSKMHEIGFDRNKTVKGVKDGKYRAVVNVNILTTGFDDRDIDLIAMLRPTNSPVLHVQALGRGSRTHPSKKNCLVLDFAGNTARLGPIHDPIIRIKGKGKEGGDPIMKTCPKCEMEMAPAIRVCPFCDHEFKFEHGLSPTAETYDQIEDGGTHWLPVHRVEYSKNVKPGSPTSVKVTYHCGTRKISDFICIEHRGFAKHKADHWVKFRGGIPCVNADELMRQVEQLKKPTEISVQKKGKYYMVKDVKF